MSWMNFDNAEQHVDRTGLIPSGTLVKVLLKIQPGAYNDPNQGWTGGFCTRSDKTGSVYLSPEYTVIGGPFDKRKVFGGLIGLFSPKGPEWGNQGRSFIRAMLESARGIKFEDPSPLASKARQITGLGDLNGLEFAAKVTIEKGQDGYADKNKIETVIPVTHKDYAAIMSGQTVASASAQSTSAPAAGAAKSSSTPAWAQ